MSRYWPHFPVLFAVVLAVCLSPLGASGQNVRQFPPGALKRAEDLPPGRLRSKIEGLPKPARDRAIQWLQSFHFTEQDPESLDVDSDGGVFYVDHFEPAAAQTQEATPYTAGASVPIVPFPDGLKFHSRPGSSRIIYLDFDGEEVTGTQWNTDLGRTTISARPFSTDGDPATFSDSEQAAIKRIWERIAEDYAPFDVDVTTERPATLTINTAQALITPTTDATGQDNPSSTAGGIAYVNVFGTKSYARYRPAWIYQNNLGNQESYIAEAASHEVGHNFGLSHDGTSSSGYYGGHGSGDTSWAPIMGTGYSRNVSQWSKGEYYLANNTQDDLVVISGKAPYISDDHADTFVNATAILASSGGLVASTTPETDPAGVSRVNKGVIQRGGDVDVFSFQTGTGAVSLQVKPWVSPANTRGGNLDVAVALFNATGTLLLTNNPETTTYASIQTNLPSGLYYIRISATGVGAPTASSPSGYTVYGSLGQYFISGALQPYDANTPTSEQYTVVHPTPYSWLIANGYTNNFESAVTNLGANGYQLWQSYIAGLQPNDPSSKLLLSIQKAASKAILNWTTVTGRVYTVLTSASPAAVYGALPGAVSLPSAANSFTNNAPAAGRVFYKLQVDKL